MNRNVPYSRFIGLIPLVGDFFLTDLASKLAYYLRFGHPIRFDNPYNYEDYYLSLFVIFNLAWITSALFTNQYSVNTLFRYGTLATSLFYAFCMYAFLIFVYVWSLKVYDLSRSFLVYAFLIAVTFILLSRLFFVAVLNIFKRSGINQKKFVIVGAGYAGNELYHQLIFNSNVGFKFMGFFDDQPEIPNLIIKGKLRHLKEYCLSEGVNEIYYAMSMRNADLIKDIADFADNNFIYFKIAPDFRGLVNRKVNIDFYNNVPIMTFRKEPLSLLINRIIKRTFDIVFSLLVILLVFPFILPVIALLIKLESPGPVFFKQLRPGRRNKLFGCYKFRSMRVNQQGERQATKNDSRITKVGAFMRKTSLDELPQFFNVLLGDMSVVGPRPNMINQLETYSKTIDKYMVRHFVLPGITGYAQVNGYRGETAETWLMERRVEYDVLYMENWSFLLDLKIIFLTVYNVFRGEKNAY
ncbi:MAG: undecaprenyl-phosphate glucose phosphotransferase [Ferruginibacter sp.]|nr:undecaprenyl-phosphate glucose phosphotransferase [Cytophagales bacterium]